jgi:hypothetical protein
LFSKEVFFIRQASPIEIDEFVWDSSGFFDLNACAGWDDGIFWDNDDAILDGPVWGDDICTKREWADDHICADAGILVDDSAFNMAVWADTDRRLSRVFGGILVCTHDNAILDDRPGGDNATYADNRVGDLGFLDTAAFSQEHIFQQTILYRGPG